jgi:transcriptional regulator with XRE-family HTH domain
MTILKVRAERLRRRWSQTVLGARAGMSASDISRIETGRLLPYPRQISRLARALKLDPAQVLDRVETSDGDGTP